MNAYDVIFKKRNGGELSPVEISFFIAGVTGGTVSPEQASAWLMAGFLRGFTPREMTALTRAMTDSGEKLDLSTVPAPTADKHSTGGVGDGTSLVLAPLLAAAGVAVPMMSGRSLGHTGGTLDKLEAIPGFRVGLGAEEFVAQLKSVGCAMIGQTDKVAPADKTLYALRDVTATVDSVPLIAASIMSKKLAEGTAALVLDVKTGSGAFMRELKDARALARAMAGIGNGAGVKTVALITDMNQPLGRAAGNALEVAQAVEVMNGRGPADFRELVLELGGWMMSLARRAKSPEEGRRRLEPLLSDGSALAKFRAMVRAQGGDPAAADDPARVLPRAKATKDFPAPRSGRVAAMDTRLVGMAVSVLGSGRAKPGDAVDHAAGMEFHKKLGDPVKKGEPLATFHYRDEGRLAEAEKRFAAAVTIAAGPVKKPRLVYEVVR